MTQLEHWTCARRSRDLLEGLERTGKVILRESALDRREFTLFAAKTTHNGYIRNWRIVLGIKGDSFQTNYSQRPRPTTDGLFHHSWSDHIFHNSRRWVCSLFSMLFFQHSISSIKHFVVKLLIYLLASGWRVALSEIRFSRTFVASQLYSISQLLRSKECTLVHATQHKAFWMKAALPSVKQVCLMLKCGAVCD